MKSKKISKNSFLGKNSKIWYYTIIGNNVKIGNNVTIWHYSYVGNNVVIGNDVNIGCSVQIDYDVKIGENTRIESMTYLPPYSKIGKDVFVGPGVIFTNDPYPMSYKLKGIVIEDGAIIGARAVIKAGIKIGKNSVIGMGSVVTKHVPENTVVAGNPATIIYSRSQYDKNQKKWQKSIT